MKQVSSKKKVAVRKVIPRFLNAVWGLQILFETDSQNIKHTFIQVEVQKHIPKPNAYMWFTYYAI